VRDRIRLFSDFFLSHRCLTLYVTGSNHNDLASAWKHISNVLSNTSTGIQKTLAATDPQDPLEESIQHITQTF